MIDADNIRDAIVEFSSTVYKKIIPSDASVEDMISQIEKGFEKLTYRRALLSYTNIFSYAIMVAAIKLKTIEIRNLSAIAFGVEQRVGLAGIKSRLIRPEQKQSQ
jgi:V/A-type H+-transporting ATPase subunit C